MSTPAEDSEHRARSIFERLRAAQQREAGAGDGPAVQEAEEGPPAGAVSGHGPEQLAAREGELRQEGEADDSPPEADHPLSENAGNRQAAQEAGLEGEARIEGAVAPWPAPALLPTEAPEPAAAPGGQVAAAASTPPEPGEVSPVTQDAASDAGTGPDHGPQPSRAGEGRHVPGRGQLARGSAGPDQSGEGTDDLHPGPAGAVVASPASPVDAPASPAPAPGDREWGAALPGGEALPQVGAAADEVPLRPARPLPRIIAVANQKGGVGKTTTAVNLGASLAELGHRVLVVDLDPQGNATTGLGINSRNLERSIYDVMLRDAPVEDCIEPTALRNLFVAPATIDLAGAEIELVPAFSRELRLRRALARIEGDFDFTLIDCPPSLGLLTVNGLAAADEVLVPIQCEYYALEGLGQLLRNVTLVQGNLNPRLEVANIVLTMYDARTRLAEQVAQEVRDHFGATVCRNVVPRTVRLSEAPSFGQPIIVFDPSSRGSIAYRELAKEVVGGAS